MADDRDDDSAPRFGLPGGYYDPDDRPEGDCPDCDGTGEVCCSCGGGCPHCVDGMRTCGGCGGSGYRGDGPGEDFDG